MYMPGAQAPRQFGHPSTWSEGQPTPPVPVQPASPPVAAAQGGNRRLFVGIVAVLGALVLVAAGVGLYLVAFAPITVDGTVTVADAGKGFSDTGCRGTGGYSDLAEGTPVAISDASGKTIAIGRLETGRVSGADCVFPFHVSVPRSDFYGIEVSHRGVVKYSRAEVQSGVMLGIGS